MNIKIDTLNHTELTRAFGMRDLDSLSEQPSTASGSQMNIGPRALTKPRLRLEEYFPGRTRAYGIFQDRFGKLRRRFLVEITGTLQGRVLTLVENFTYDDGEREQRTWSIKCLDQGLYEGHTDGVLGTAQGGGQGNVLNWSYNFALPIGDRRWKVRFNDWFFLHEDDVLFNRAEVSKFGIRIGEATMVFHKLQ